MVFRSVDEAHDWARKNRMMIYVEIEGADGVLQVYPGGRAVFMGADKGRVYQNWRKRLTPDSEFMTPDEYTKQSEIVTVKFQQAQCPCGWKSELFPDDGSRSAKKSAGFKLDNHLCEAHSETALLPTRDAE
jgi:hypothetical protein